MKTNKNILLLSATFLLFVFALTGCGGASNTVETCVISHEQYSDKDTLESAQQPESFEAEKDIYASVYFIESPRAWSTRQDGRWTVARLRAKPKRWKPTSRV
jgi:hypothetical protein